MNNGLQTAFSGAGEIESCKFAMNPSGGLVECASGTFWVGEPPEVDGGPSVLNRRPPLTSFFGDSSIPRDRHRPPSVGHILGWRCFPEITSAAVEAIPVLVVDLSPMTQEPMQIDGLVGARNTRPRVPTTARPGGVPRKPRHDGSVLGAHKGNLASGQSNLDEWGRLGAHRQFLLMVPSRGPDTPPGISLEEL